MFALSVGCTQCKAEAGKPCVTYSGAVVSMRRPHANRVRLGKAVAQRKGREERQEEVVAKGISDGSTADYYELPPGATELQDLISHKNMNAQIGEILRSCYRYGESSHSDQLRDAKKIKFYINAEIKRLEKIK